MNYKFLQNQLSKFTLAVLLLAGGSVFAADPVLEDIQPVRAKKGAQTNVVAVATDAEDGDDKLTMEVTKADGSAANGFKVAYTAWANGYMIEIDGSVVSTGIYNVTVTDSQGGSATKPLDVTIDDSGSDMSTWNWPIFTLTEETGTFQLTFDIVPHGDKIDAAVALSDGNHVYQGWADLSAVIRFKIDGTLDVSDGGSYSSVNTINYEDGKMYSFVADVDVVGGKYSVSVTPEGGSSTVIATDYAFRKNVGGIKNIVLPASFWSYTISNISGPALGMSSKYVDEFRVYPNPSNGGVFSIALPESTKDISVQIFDANGRMVSSSVVKGKVYTSNLNLSTGVYLVKISNSDFELSKKLMVK